MARVHCGQYACGLTWGLYRNTTHTLACIVVGMTRIDLPSIDTPTGTLDVYTCRDGIELYIQPDGDAESVDLVLTREQAAALIARLAAALAESA